jgi:hypothetical protein
MSAVEVTLERLSEADQGRVRIGRRGDSPRGFSLLALMREYLRRQALWTNQLGMESSFCVDLASSLLPGFRCPPEALSRMLVFPQSSAERKCCQNILAWYALIDSHGDLVRAFNLPDPYEPLVRFFERGGAFSVEHGVSIDVYLVGMVNANCVQEIDLRKPITALDHEALDAIDAAGLQ